MVRLAADRLSSGSPGVQATAARNRRERPGLMRAALLGAVGAALLAGIGLAEAKPEAKPPLREVTSIDDNMLSIAIAHEISEECDEIEPRTLKGLSYLFSLRREAQILGYTNQEIKQYHESDAEKARIRAKGETYVKSKGLDPGSAADLCTLGHAEIARNSMIGTFLRAK